jgi:hypothetical protein
LSGSAVLGWPSWSEVVGVDLVSGAPHVHVCDQLGRHVSVSLGPGRRFTLGVAADLVGELSNKL